MISASILAPAAAALALFAGQAAQAECKLQKTAEIPISLVNNQPMVDATINGKPIDAAVAVFPELAIGDETIKNLPLAVANIFPDVKSDRLPQVVLGADFFRSHRVYISIQQKRLYFSYEGGVLFQDIYKRLGAEPAPASPRTPKP